MWLLMGPSAVAVPDGREQTALSVLQFMTKNPAMRLGSPGLGGESAILRHPYFKELDWDLLNQRQMEPPFRPRIVRGGKGSLRGFCSFWLSKIYSREMGKR